MAAASDYKGYSGSLQITWPPSPFYSDRCVSMLYLPQVTSSINVQSVWGALFIGSITNAVFVLLATAFEHLVSDDLILSLFGIFCLQCYTFLQRWRRENRRMVYSVIVLLLLNIFHLVTVCDLSYFYMVKYFGQDKFALLSPPWSGPTVVLLTVNIMTIYRPLIIDY
ncbi:hypothetical protein PHLGIDRAFT_283083 [Phlebiopsis gigantea 11061_1 CR5-6]|uniref:Uncharacterized protein n=1 Tax=Phlebiopsis gigantea (strain 11061_1 CR5-6) TaxID=745531 RepID=A0A0C3S0W8_PHLG1|nr:hypothetical protein PHLGIDRAFT_283083 [Phlebiopsis gigantea 11061_1 CR5-6]